MFGRIYDAKISRNLWMKDKNSDILSKKLHLELEF